MSFHDYMFEDGFRDEQDYMDHLMNKAQERTEERLRKGRSGFDSRLNNKSGSRGRWLVDAQMLSQTFCFLDKKSEDKLRSGNPLSIEVPCVAKKAKWNFSAFGLVLASDIDRMRALVNDDGLFDYGAFINSDIPCLTASDNREKEIIRTGDELFDSIGLGDIVRVDFNFYSGDLIAIRVREVVEKAGDDVWVP